MARLTENLGLQVIEPGDDPYMSGHKFFAADRDNIDQYLTLAMGGHVHNGSSIGSPAVEEQPALAVDSTPTSGGSIPAGRRLWYRYSIVDNNGLESQAGPHLFIDAPSPVAKPAKPDLSWGSTGGTLMPGTYSYVLSAWVDAPTNETQASDPSATAIPTGSTENRVIVTFPPAPVGAHGFNIYRRKPGGVNYDFIDTVTLDIATPPEDYIDYGLSEDCDRIAPKTNLTNSTNAVTVETFDFMPDDGWSWKLYRTSNPDNWDGSFLARVFDSNQFVDLGMGTQSGSPVTFTPNLSNPQPVHLDGETQGQLGLGRIDGVPSTAIFEFPGLVEEQIGTRQWRCPFPAAVVVGVACHLGLGSEPASDDVIVQVNKHRSGSDVQLYDPDDSEWERPRIEVGENAGPWFQPRWDEAGENRYEWDSVLWRNDMLTIDIDQAGGGATPTDFDLTVVVYLVAFDFGLTFNRTAWDLYYYTPYWYF